MYCSFIYFLIFYLKFNNLYLQMDEVFEGEGDIIAVNGLEIDKSNIKF